MSVVAKGLAVAEIASYLDAYLGATTTPDYPSALNGLQLTHRGPVRRIAAAVDTSLRAIDAAIAADANLLLVHHGMFWAAPERFVGAPYERMQRLLAHDIAVYSAHLPLDVHAIHGNSRLLALELGLAPSGGFAAYQGVECGVRGLSDLPTSTLRERLTTFSQDYGGGVVATPFEPARRTRHWAICSGAGASRDTLNEAQALGIDTLIVGEGPHWTAVDADDRGLVILYGGHYATETLGVQSLAAHLAERFHVPWMFVSAPTGL